MSDLLLSRLQSSAEYDAAILRIAEGDFGCEERETPMLWILFLLRDGTRFSREIPEPLAGKRPVFPGDNGPGQHAVDIGVVFFFSKVI